MKWFYNMKISAKLILGFVLVAMIAGIIGAIGYYYMNSMYVAGNTISDVKLPSIQAMLVMSEAQTSVDSAENALLTEALVGKDRQAQYDRITDAYKRADEARKIYEPLPQTPQEKIVWDKFVPAWDKWKSDDTAYINLCKQFDTTKSKETHEKMIEQALVTNSISFSAAEDLLNQIIKINQDEAKLEMAAFDNLYASAVKSIIIVIIIGVIIALGLGIFISKIISNPLKKALNMLAELKLGHLNTRLNMDTKDEVGQMAQAMDGFADDLKENVVIVMQKISQGDVSMTVKAKDDKDEISPALQKTIDTIKGLATETDRLIKSTKEGKLDTRGNHSTYQGAWADLLKGVNEMIDAFVAPFNVTAEYVERIGNGDIPPKITDTYYGDFNEIKNNLNKCIDTLNGLLTESNMLVNAAVEGQLATRSDASKFQGGWRELVAGINKTLDAVIGPLNVSAEYVDRISKGDIPAKITDTYKGDFNEIKNNLNTCIDAVNALVKDATMLATAAVEGKLSTRADASKHGGDFAKIVEGVNKTLDAVIKPVEEASSVLQEMAKGNLKVSVKGNYMGDHATIKDALNDTVSTISGYITELSSVLIQMADGNFNVEATSDYRGDFVQIKNSLNQVINSFNDVLGNMNESAEQVASGSRQVSNGSQALSQGSTEQASSIEELSASVTEIAAQTKQNAINANQANEVATNARDNAVKGDSQMKEMLDSMEKINESSANISKIIKVIDEIAFQTNILALNAAVEAARAGQHGKGFAVVAEEVRNLAARSANAAKETTALIEGSIIKVETGTKIANDTAAALTKIVLDVEKATNLVANIAVASNEQATGIAQINKGIDQLSSVVQTNSATAEQSAAASEELSAQADLLKGMVTKFKLKKGNSFSNFESGRDEHQQYNTSKHNSKQNSANRGSKGSSRDIIEQFSGKLSMLESGFDKF